MSPVHEYGVWPSECILFVILGYLLSLKQCFLTVLQAVIPRTSVFMAFIHLGFLALIHWLLITKQIFFFMGLKLAQRMSFNNGSLGQHLFSAPSLLSSLFLPDKLMRVQIHAVQQSNGTDDLQHSQRMASNRFRIDPQKPIRFQYFKSDLKAHTCF